MQSKENAVHVYENTLDTDEPGPSRRGQKTSEDKAGNLNSSFNRIKCLVYVMIVMSILLYAGVFVVIAIATSHVPDKQADGNWTQWTDWSACDVTCGVGAQSRFRSCSNQMDRACVGNITEMSICRLPLCSSEDKFRKCHHVSFSARVIDMNQNVNQNTRIVFKEVSNNIMNGYSSNSGIFKAPLSGIYMFVYFIEINGAYGKIEMRLNNKSVSTTTLYGMFTEIDISGINNDVTFESSKTDKGAKGDNLRCVAGKLSVSGNNINVNINPSAFDKCPYQDGVKATGGNSVVVHVKTGDQVWIQNSDKRRISIRPYGTTFTGVLFYPVTS